MGIPVLVLGASGSGKSSSMRNFKPEEVGILNVASKPLPFRAKLNKMDKPSYEQIKQILRGAKVNAYVIDDSQYLMAFDSFDKADIKGYDKWSDMAVNFYKVIQTAIKETPDDVIVYFLHHTEVTDDGRIKAKTLGKMLDNQLTVEGLFPIVLLAKTDGEKYWFETRNSGSNTVKTPMEMFESAEIPNDLKMVDSVIREYWGLKPLDKIERN